MKTGKEEKAEAGLWSLGSSTRPIARTKSNASKETRPSARRETEKKGSEGTCLRELPELGRDERE